jgi:hypothetical protein
MMKTYQCPRIFFEALEIGVNPPTKAKMKRHMLLLIAVLYLVAGLSSMTTVARRLNNFFSIRSLPANTAGTELHDQDFDCCAWRGQLQRNLQWSPVSPTRAGE